MYIIFFLNNYLGYQTKHNWIWFCIWFCEQIGRTNDGNLFQYFIIKRY